MVENITFTRNINLELLNEVFEEYIAGFTKAESKEKLDEIIGQSINSKDNIRKTRTILQNLWYENDDWLKFEAVEAARYLTKNERLPVHWAILLLSYPIFFDLCTVIGQLLELRDCISAKQIKDEIYNKWGARSTLESSLSKNLKSLRDMNILKRANKHSFYEQIKHKVNDPRVIAVLFATIIRTTGQQYMTWESFMSHPAIFPFDICDVTQADMAAVSYLTMERIGDQVVFWIILPKQ